jgi:hypothetical protein
MCHIYSPYVKVTVPVPAVNVVLLYPPEGEEVVLVNPAPTVIVLLSE